jgi:hypothetical protein
LLEKFKWEEFSYKKVLPNLKSKKILIIDFNPRKDFDSYKKIPFYQDLVINLKKYFENISFEENVQYCSTIKELSRLKDIKFRLIYFCGYFSTGLNFLNSGGEANEVISLEKITSFSINKNSHL